MYSARLFGTIVNEIGQSISGMTASAGGESYNIGQLSRKYLDYRTEGIQNYREQVAKIGVDFGASAEENLMMANLTGRFGTGTSRLGVPSGRVTEDASGRK